MSDTPPVLPNLPEINHTFILRLTWDECSDNWHILLKPINGQAARLFSDMESMFFYLEAMMRAKH